MKSLLLHGLIGGILLGMFYILARHIHFPAFPINMVLIPGGMMFTINGFLKPKQNRKQYSYFLGVCLGFAYALLAVGIGYGIFQISLVKDFSNFSFSSFLRMIEMAFKSMLILIVITSFLMPLLFLKNSKDIIEKTKTDILDEDI